MQKQTNRTQKHTTKHCVNARDTGHLEAPASPGCPARDDVAPVGLKLQREAAAGSGARYFRKVVTATACVTAVQKAAAARAAAAARTRSRIHGTG